VARTGTLLAATVAAIAVLIPASGAEARWTSNVCPNAGFARFNAADLGPNEERFCNPRWTMDSGDPGLNWEGDPYWKHGWHVFDQQEPPWDPESGCGLNWSIKGSETDAEDPTLPMSADWDYWVNSVLSGVSWLPPWGGSATWASRGTSDAQKRLLGAYAIYPEYNNWAPWASLVQTLATCVPAKTQAASARAAGARSTERGWTHGPDRVVGGRGRDRISTGAGNDRIAGGGERDRIDGGTGHDRIDAGPGHDDVHGGAGSDRLHGRRGNDTLLGGPHDDVAHGGPGQDRLFDNEGRDRLHGGPHTDFLSARDGDRDIVDCGPGIDVAVGDRQDVYRGCEHVYDGTRPDPRRPPRIGNGSRAR
jgi:hypothetical protein